MSMASFGPYWVGDKPRDSVVVTIERDGEPIVLTGYTGASIELYDPDGVLVSTVSTTVQIINNTVAITWPTVSLFTEPGIYTLYVILLEGSHSERAAVLTFEVLGLIDPVDAWATITDVRSITGLTVDTEDIARAQYVIDSVSGASSLDPTRLKVRDKRFLKLAVAYQVAWMQSQVDLLGRTDVQNFSQDGQSATMRTSTSLILAPLARQALNRCSWAGRFRTRRVAPACAQTVVSPYISDEHPWVKY
jgi:hypothetical protein